MLTVGGIKLAMYCFFFFEEVVIFFSSIYSIWRNDELFFTSMSLLINIFND